MSLAPLVSKTCTPCRGGVPPLTFSEVATHHQQTAEWSILDEAHRIERTYKFKNFAEAYAFVQKVAELAESEGHHPDVSFWMGLRHGLSTNEEDQEACTRTTSSSPKVRQNWPVNGRHLTNFEP
jgi:pterin-4a-carbinolamine dehydratase